MIDINQQYMNYSDSIIFSILLKIVPDKFLKTITYNSVVDTKETITEDLIEKGKNSADVDRVINLAINKILDSYDLKKL